MRTRPRLRVATACVKPYSVREALGIFAGTDVLACAVIGFPHGNSTTGIKAIEAESAALAGAKEIDMVVNVGKVKSGAWVYVRREIDLINQATVSTGPQPHRQATDAGERSRGDDGRPFEPSCAEVAFESLAEVGSCAKEEALY